MEPTERDIHEVVRSTWSAFLRAEVMRLSPDESRAGGERAGAPIVGSIDIGGAWEGEVLLRCDEAIGRRAASIFFDLPPESVGAEEIDDAVAELTNVLGGNLKCLLPPGCRLSLPRVAERAGQGAFAPDGAVGFSSLGSTFHVTLRRHHAAARGDG